MSPVTLSRRTPYRMTSALWCAGLLFAISAVGCGDTPPDNTPTPPSEQVPPDDTTPPDIPDIPDEGTPPPDYSDVEPIPCTGQELCYDPTDPDILARAGQYRAWLEELEGLDIPGEYTAEEAAALHKELDEVMRQTHIVLGLCNYFRDEDDNIRVDCPDELEDLFFCPHMWFRPEMPTIGGIRFSPDELPTCFPTLVPEEDVICTPQGCPQGTVCTGRFTLSGEPVVPDDGLGLHPIPVCLPTEDCLRLRAGQSLDPEQSCYYSDLSTVETGQLDTVDCENLAPYTCAVNCPCAENGARCSFIGEANPVGLCVTAGCSYAHECDDADYDSCAVPRGDFLPSLYEWFRDTGMKELYELPVPPFGRCANKTTCQDVFPSNNSPIACY